VWRLIIGPSTSDTPGGTSSRKLSSTGNLACPGAQWRRVGVGEEEAEWLDLKGNLAVFRPFQELRTVGLSVGRFAASGGKKVIVPGIRVRARA